MNSFIQSEGSHCYLWRDCAKMLLFSSVFIKINSLVLSTSWWSVLSRGINNTSCNCGQILHALNIYWVILCKLTLICFHAICIASLLGFLTNFGLAAVGGVACREGNSSVLGWTIKSGTTMAIRTGDTAGH